jgi:hypothetical protein
MNGASGQSMSGHQRAETYLRLQLEAELRTALGFPRYRQPRQPRGPGPLASLARSRRSVNIYRSRATARTLGRARSVQARLTPEQGRSLLQRSASRIWQPVAPRWHRAVFGFWHFRAHVRARLDRSGRDQEPPAESCVYRLTGLATAFASAGAVDEDTAEALVADLRTALAARGLIDQDQLLAAMGSGHSWPGQRAASGPGSLRAIPVGAVTDCETDGRSGRVYLGALVLDANNAELTVQARFSLAAGAASIDMTRRHGRHPLMAIFDACSATDDRGGSYYAHFSGGGGDEDWDGTLHFLPVPPATAQWLDISVPGAAPVRVDLTVPPVSYPVTSTPLAEESLAERYVDGVCVELLQSADVDGLRDGQGADQAAAIAGLLMCGFLTDHTPALRRFAAVARRLRLDLPAPLADVRPQALPAEWLAMLDRWDRDDGPAGVVPLAAMLPELDGARCVITGLRSGPDGTTMQVHARGWPAGSRFRELSLEPFSWAARDDVGGWYTTGEEGGGYSSDGRADMDLRLMPAISPAARSLEVILTGKTGQVSVTVPLDWQEGI